MNEHLRSVFNVILPVLDLSNVKYWVFGGIANAAFVGNFFRRNKDVDIFILDKDFQHTKVIIEAIIKKNNWIRKDDNSIKDRPKFELKIDNEEIFSVIPVYKIDGKIELRLYKNIKRYPIDILNQTHRQLGGFDFYTPSDEYIKYIFIAYLETRPDLRVRQKEDAMKILTKEEFNKYFPKESYKKI